MTTEAYKAAKKAHLKASRSVGRANKKKDEAYAKLLMERSCTELVCSCGHGNKVSDITLLHEIVPDACPAPYDDFAYTDRYTWACSNCGCEWDDPRSEMLPIGIAEICNKTLKWEGKEPTDVTAIRRKRRLRDSATRAKSEKAQAIRRAKKLLADEGEL